MSAANAAPPAYVFPLVLFISLYSPLRIGILLFLPRRYGSVGGGEPNSSYHYVQMDRSGGAALGGAALSYPVPPSAVDEQQRGAGA